MKRIAKVLVALICTAPCVLLDFGEVFTESYTGAAISKLKLPKLWAWAVNQ